MSIFVIDTGTSSMRGLLYTQDGKVEHTVQIGYDVAYIPGGLAEQNPTDWQHALQDIGREIAEYAAAKSREIKAVALTAQRSSIIPVNKGGTPLRNAIMWMDRRNGELCDRQAKYNAVIAEKTGARMNTVFSGGKMMWIKENERELYDKAYKIMTIADYLMYKMTGEFVTDTTYGSRSLLMNVRIREWDDDLLSLFGIARDKLCRLMEPGSIVGYLTKEFAAQTHLQEGLPLISAGGDQQCAALGIGVAQKSDVGITAGTGAFIMAYADKVPKNLCPDVICGAHAIPGKYILESSILGCSSLYNWFQQQFYRGTVSSGYTEINDEVCASPPGANGCIALPYFQGRGTPDWNNKMRGCFDCMTLDTTRGDMARALLESITYEIANNIDVLENYIGTVKNIYINGGLTQFSAFNRIQATVYNHALQRMANAEQTALGAFISAAVTMGCYDTYEECLCVVKAQENIEICLPDDTLVELYRKKRAQMNQLRAARYK
jgi:sugar (pentulose or hexulose) kinase